MYLLQDCPIKWEAYCQWGLPQLSPLGESVFTLDHSPDQAYQVLGLSDMSDLPETEDKTDAIVFCGSVLCSVARGVKLEVSPKWIEKCCSQWFSVQLWTSDRCTISSSFMCLEILLCWTTWGYPHQTFGIYLYFSKLYFLKRLHICVCNLHFKIPHLLENICMKR